MTQQTLPMQNQQWLYQKLDNAKEFGNLDQFLETPKLLSENLNPEFELREYQKEAFARFFYYFEEYPSKETPIHLLYNMATGSGKTLVMAGLILYLYGKGYRNFLFFVSFKNIIEKTKDNFLNNQSGKYLFNQKIQFQNKEIFISQVDNFEGVSSENINICFTTIQKLHSDLHSEKENALTFEDFREKKIVLLADEAHHGQAKTKQQAQALRQRDEKPNWENTVLKIFEKNKENILLEFTATMDFLNKQIEKKYISKVIYQYDLKHFRNDRFSKDVEILRSDTDKKGRILQALIINQYRQDIAGKHRINLKPVILFKSHHTIQESKENQEFFHRLIENLSVKELEEIQQKTNIKEIKRAFTFFEGQGSLEQLIQKLQRNFAENKCIGMNEENELEQNQILVNSLEDNNNQIRAIFVVNKLNEGWDVLNLFDIVRLYEGQAGGGNRKIAPSTISEAQLVGRGARYFPFVVKTQKEEKFLRKFDNNLGDELRILEELYFHSPNESRYISELKQALVEQGIIDDNTEERELKLKETFKKTELYKQGRIFKNKKIAKDYSSIKSFADLGVHQKNFDYEIPTGRGKITDALTEENYDNFTIHDKKPRTLKINKIERHIVKNALARKEFFCFASVKKYFPNLQSLNELIENKEFLSDIGICFYGLKEDTENLSNINKFQAVLQVLDEIEEKLKNNITDYQGTEKFNADRIHKVFFDKTLKIKADSEKKEGQEEFLKNKDWYAFNANYGTDEEKACVEFIDRLIEEDFKRKYKEIYLLRNELHFVIYNFSDGRGFAPDFVLFLKDKKGKELSYQIFIEPKGKYLAGTDDWKNEFLKKIRENFNAKNFAETKKYRVVGVPFFDKDEENKFKENLQNVLQS